MQRYVCDIHKPFLLSQVLSFEQNFSSIIFFCMALHKASSG